MYDISSGIETQITDDSANQQSPDIYGDYIVWGDYRDYPGNSETYVYNVLTEVETRLTFTPEGEVSHSIFGNRIAWTSTAGTSPYPEANIFVFDLVTFSTRRLTPIDGYGQVSPTIYGNRVAWIDGSFGHAIETLDITSSNSPYQVPTDTVSYKGGLSLFGDRLVWSDLRNQNNDLNYDIFLFDFNTRTESQLTSRTSRQTVGGLYGTRLVWTDDRNGDLDIYYGNLLVPLPPIHWVGVISTNIESIPSGDFAAPSNKQSAGTFQTLSATSGGGDKVRENRKNSLLNRLQAVTMELQVAETTTDSATQNSAYQSAVDQLHSMLEKMDGFAERGSADVKGSGFTPDWIITANSQGLVDPLIRDLIVSLEALIVPSQ